MLRRGARFEIGQPEDRFHQQGRVDGAALWAPARCDVFRALVGGYRSSSGKLFCDQQLAVFPIRRDFLDAIGDFRDQPRPGAAAWSS